MYAIIKTGGKQYRVENEDIIDVELLDAEIGAQVEFDEVLFVYDGSNALVGEPKVSGYVVKGEVIGSAVGPKVVSLKYKPRQHQQKKWGHRQKYTRVKITDIGGEGKPKAKAAPKKAEPKAEPKKAAPKAEPKAAAKKAEAKPAPKAKPKAAPKKSEKKPEPKAKPKAAAKKAAPKAPRKKTETKPRAETKRKTKGEESK